MRLCGGIQIQIRSRKLLTAKLAKGLAKYAKEAALVKLSLLKSPQRTLRLAFVNLAVQNSSPSRHGFASPPVNLFAELLHDDRVILISFSSGDRHAWTFHGFLLTCWKVRTDCRQGL